MRASHSRLSTWRRCRRKYLFSYGLGFKQPPGMGQLVGRVGHEALALWYVNNNEPVIDDAVLEYAEEKCDEYEVDDDGKTRLLAALPRYFEFARENDNFKVLAIEENFTVSVDENQLNGIIDLIVELPDGRRGIVEHKFNQAVNLEHLGLDPQPTIYLLGSRKYNTEFVIYNVVRVSRGKAARENPVVREVVERSPVYVDQFLEELRAQFDELEKWHKNPKRALVSYANPMHSCVWDCGFFEPCKTFYEGGDITDLSALPTYEGDSDMAEGLHDNLLDVIGTARDLGYRVRQDGSEIRYWHKSGAKMSTTTANYGRRKYSNNVKYQLRKKAKTAGVIVK